MQERRTCWTGIQLGGAEDIGNGRQPVCGLNGRYMLDVAAVRSQCLARDLPRCWRVVTACECLVEGCRLNDPFVGETFSGWGHD